MGISCKYHFNNMHASDWILKPLGSRQDLIHVPASNLQQFHENIRFCMAGRRVESPHVRKGVDTLTT